MADFTVNDGAVFNLGRDPEIVQHLLGLAYLVEAEAKSLASGRMVNVQTGRLAGSISTRLVSTVNGVEIQIGSNVEYAPYVHDGTKPHVILPRRAKVLRFTSRGQVVFARRVNHPGTRPRPFLARALDIIR